MTDCASLPDLSNRLARLALHCFMILLSACGGGGAEDGAPEATPSGVFAPPSGALCASRDRAGQCARPTASAATAAQVLAAITQPSGDLYRIEGFGWQQRWTYQAVNGQITESSHTYAHGRKSLVVGRNQVVVDGQAYAFHRQVDAGTVEFTSADPQGSVTVSVFDQNILNVVHSTGSGQVTGVPEPGGAIQQSVDSTVWSAETGLLTDRSDAATGSAVRYAGTLTLFGGDGRPAGVRNLVNTTSGSCTITLELNANTGALTVPAVQCTAPNGAVLRFALTSTFDVEDSTLKHKSAIQGTATLQGPAQGDAAAEAPMVATGFSLSAVDGEFSGRGARTLHLSGAGDGGGFYIKATKQ